MKVILNVGLIGLVIFLGILRNIYMGEVVDDLVFTLTGVVLPILTGVTVGVNLFFKKSSDNLSVIVKSFVVGICIMISSWGGFAYIWTFDDTITKNNIESYNIVEDVVLEVDTIDFIRSDKKEIDMYIKYKGVKKNFDSFTTRNSLDLDVTKTNTIKEYELYLIKYNYCYDLKDSKYRKLVFPIVMDNEGDVVGVSKNEFISSMRFLQADNSLRYLNNEELAKEIYMSEVVNFTDKEFFGLACSNLFLDESTKQIVLENIEKKMQEGKILEEDLTSYRNSIFSYEIQKYYNVAY